MAIDPDVVVELDTRLGVQADFFAKEIASLSTRLDALESGPVNTSESYLDQALASATSTVKVALPRGPMEPQQTVGVDAEAAGVATWTSSKYLVTRDWDEDTEGAFLQFTKGQVDWNGHTLTGVHHVLHPSIESLSRKNANVGGGTGSRYLLVNPLNVRVADCFMYGQFHMTGVTVLDPIGDIWRPDDGSSITDFYFRIGMEPGNWHYDGMQFHNKYNAATGMDRAHQTIRRGVFDRVPLDPSTGQPVGQMTGNIFFQSDNLEGAVVEDILVLGASGVWFPIRFTGSGRPTMLRNIQLMGERGPAQNNPSSNAPAAFIMASALANGVLDRATVFVDVPGVTTVKTV